MLFSAYVTDQTSLLRLTFSVDKIAGLHLPNDAQKISFYHQNVNSVSPVQRRASREAAQIIRGFWGRGNGGEESVFTQ